MKLWRCQFDNAVDGFDFREDTGGAFGKGIYAMPAGSTNMKKYYSVRGEKTFEFEIPDNLVKKIGGKGITTYWAIKEAIYREQLNGFKAFICKHKGINIPTGKQIVITDASIVSNVKQI